MAKYGSRCLGGERLEARHLKTLCRVAASLAVELGRRRTAARWLQAVSMRHAKGRKVHQSKRRM
eukprot:2197308-Pleurochrysis_carterae.AAC.1